MRFDLRNPPHSVMLPAPLRCACATHCGTKDQRASNTPCVLCRSKPPCLSRPSSQDSLHLARLCIEASTQTHAAAPLLLLLLLLLLLIAAAAPAADDCCCCCASTLGNRHPCAVASPEAAVAPPHAHLSVHVGTSRLCEPRSAAFRPLMTQWRPSWGLHDSC